MKKKIIIISYIVAASLIMFFGFLDGIKTSQSAKERFIDTSFTFIVVDKKFVTRNLIVTTKDTCCLFLYGGISLRKNIQKGDSVSKKNGYYGYHIYRKGCTNKKYEFAYFSPILKRWYF